MRKKEVNSSKTDESTYRSQISLRTSQEAEMFRFEKMGVGGTTRADTIRDVVDEGILAVQKKRGLEPLKADEIQALIKEIRKVEK